MAKNTEFNRFRTQMWLTTQILTGSELVGADWTLYPPGRCFVTNFLIDSRAFYRKCIFCSQESKNIFLHHLFLCSKLEKQRHLLRSKLLLYNFPIEILGNKSIFYKTVLSRKVWTKCFSDFLADIDHRNQV